ncbi:aminodeoxychorismate lyase [Wenzhouxiangella sediminis]|uniref:Aminodeoxychorismate lyase n=1 Tax=Wenzhouxiangella sediminis TaxID=1792836 RepID=A0A3E1KBU1_9GAMM|nr:aminodeoxychorismate lyase [Wenzhouxiangella sediminis]RFF32196.1 aminodeoxychorismate lyase [Wenzhouxiangella sediminis]
MVEALIDGRASDCVPPDDRGLLYGDHQFETIAFVGGRAPLWELHMRRLARDCERLLIPPPDERVLAAECAMLAEGRSRCVVRISITRGSGGRAYEPPSRPVPRRILLRRPWPAALASARRDGIVLHSSPVRLAVGGPLAGIKHGNRLEQVLAAEHARRAGVDEAILFDIDGRLVEAIAGNLIVVVDGLAVTPARPGSGVAGVGLQALTERLGVILRETKLEAEDLGRAEAVMVINSVAGIRPAQRLDDRRLAIPGELRRWQRLWDELFECED